MRFDSGPSAEETRRKAIENAKQRQEAVRAAALRESSTGIIQLFGPGNPALNIPGVKNRVNRMIPSP